ncbi:aldo/keto reductase [Nocardiopsis sp. FR26]|uniref:aldo/keto reductase n=1 Tax=Nocardiopsis sp. FR26 TaxID=2605987 RepID=UPI00191505C0|nr:aldo/keto reductase [Nocardiopsis sp. FR26]
MTRLDTAFNYQRFDAHRSLADAAGDLLASFEISTKVGFFPDGHDLCPKRLRTVVREVPEQLGCVPGTVLLHNPECSADGFEEACTALSEMRDAGYCRAWGLSSWNPQALADHDWAVPRPDVVMVRAGLSVPAPVLEAAERLSARLGARAVWGMAPFGGDAAGPLWSGIDTSLFLASGQRASRVQATVTAARAIPKVERLAVGTSSPAHLEEIVQAESLAVSVSTVDRYRALLRRRAERVDTAS